MAATSIPKSRLIQLITDELQATHQASEHFKIQGGTDVPERLMGFTKDNLLSFVISLGENAARSLKALETQFPLRQSPTLYLETVEESLVADDLLRASNELSGLGREGGMLFKDGDTVRFVYLPQLGVRTLRLRNISIFEYLIHYEHKIEYVQANPEAEDYSELKEDYSLETAFVWLPVEQHSHAVIACNHYPALKRIQYYLGMRLGIHLSPPFLTKAMLEKITRDSTPRSVTYSLNTFQDDDRNVQTITLIDPSLPQKDLYGSVTNNPDMDQMAGFYNAHPGLALGGIGVARRDGKVWTPKKMDRNDLASLSLTIIEQTEEQLANTDDLVAISKYFFANRVKIGNVELHGKDKQTWIGFIPRALEAVRDGAEKAISQKLLNELVRDQRGLHLLTAIEYTCESCGVRSQAKCPTDQILLDVIYDNGIRAVCPICKEDFSHQYICECGAEHDVDDLSPYVKVAPDENANKSIAVAAKKAKLDYKGFWGLYNYTLQYIRPKQQVVYPRLSLTDFQLWINQGRIQNPIRSTLSSNQLQLIINRTKEKCPRDGIAASHAKCDPCKLDHLRPEWIKNGDTCLLRLYGIPIGIAFDGIHSGAEVADLWYADTLRETNRQVRVGIHVKSRYHRQPPKGVGRSIRAVEGLYKQVVFSAYNAAVRGVDIQVIGIAMPNRFKQDVLDSMAYAVNTLGFSFVVIEEDDWKVIIDSAYQQVVFDSNGN